MRAACSVLLAVLAAGCGDGAVSAPESKGLCKAGPAGYRICGVPTGDRHRRPLIERLGEDGSWREITGPVGWQPRGAWVGHWAWIDLSPDGKTVLARWSGECETSTAFFVPAEGGKPRPVTDERDASDVPVSTSPIGWTRDGRARVRIFGNGGCGVGARKPGIYLIEPSTGRATFARPLSRES